MPNRNNEVDRFIADLKHSHKGALELVRAAILDSNKAITEHIKWKAPSFCFAGDDRVTFRLPPKGGLQLIFHRGAKVKDTRGFAFEDSSGLLEWVAADRAIVTLADIKDATTKKAKLVRLVNRWMKATS